MVLITKPKKRGRPPGSKNKTSKKAKSSKKSECAIADESFGEAFGHIEVASPEVYDDEIDFAAGNDTVALYEGVITGGSTLEDLVGAAAELEDGDSNPYEEEQQHLEEENAGFGESDLFGVEYLIELAGNETIEQKEDIMKELRDSCIAAKSKGNYYSAIVVLIYYYYTVNQSKLNKSWVQALDSFGFNQKYEKKK